MFQLCSFVNSFSALMIFCCCLDSLHDLPISLTMNHLNACRTSPSEFVIPYHKYLKTEDNNLTIGSRFKMKFESDESTERRCDSPYTVFRPFFLCFHVWVCEFELNSLLQWLVQVFRDYCRYRGC